MGIGAILGWIGGWLILLILTAMCWALLRARQKMAIVERVDEASQRWLDQNIEPVSKERVYDTVPLDEATFIKEEKYLLAECGDEQFKQAKAMRYPLKLGYFKKEGWTGGLPFYLFCCFFCERWEVGYKQGLRPYLYCGHCENVTTFAVFSCYRDEVKN